MDCHHFDAGRCRSCTWLPRPYDDQVVDLQNRCAAALAGHIGLLWEPPYRSAESGFRNKAKMVVTGTATEPNLGILDQGGAGVDLRDCGLHVPAIRQALPVLAAFIARADVTPYDVGSRSGELKFLLVTASPVGELMVRFVTRSQEPVARLRKHLPWLLGELPGLVVASVNLQPEHKAVIEGEREILLTEQAVLPMRINGHDLLLRPQSFFQTNTEVAAALYRDAAEWIDERDPRSVWDLYCGVGGFALHVGRPGRTVLGVETSAEAVASATETASRSGSAAAFVAGDATAHALAAAEVPELVVVNPPRRGIGDDLAGWLNASEVRTVLYSSCNPESLARDLAAMPAFAAVRARLFDMFPQTAHAEVLVRLDRQPAVGRTAPDAVPSRRAEPEEPL